MAKESEYTKHIHLMLESNGQIFLDDVIQDGSIEPLKLDPNISLEPCSIKDLIDFFVDTIGDNSDTESASDLRSILLHLEECIRSVESAIKK